MKYQENEMVTMSLERYESMIEERQKLLDMIERLEHPFDISEDGDGLIAFINEERLFDVIKAHYMRNVGHPILKSKIVKGIEYTNKVNETDGE